MTSSFAGRFQVGAVDVALCTLESYTGPNSLSAERHLVGRLHYPCTDNIQGLAKASWMPSWEYAKGFTEFIFQRKTAWYVPMAKSSLCNMAWWMGQLKLPMYKGAAVASADASFPVLLLSHGVGGTRTASSIISGTLASQGIAVFAIEHADGSSSTTALAGGFGFTHYAGWAERAERDRQIQYRMQELQTALKVIRALGRGENMPGLTLSDGMDSRTAFRRLDADCVGLAGHSYGALTVGTLIAQDPQFPCAIAIDPWWGQLPADSAITKAWRTTGPLLILGSQAWNTPNDKGQMVCDAEGQATVMQASTRREGQEGAGTGPGSALVVIAGSTHDTAVDAKALYSAKYGWLLKWVIPHKKGTEGLVLDPVLGLELTSRCMVHFLQQRLPLTAEQRSMIEVAATPKPSTGRQPSQSLHKQASSTPTGPAPSVRDVSQRQQPRPIAQNDRAAFENITKGHLFKIQLAT